MTTTPAAGPVVMVTSSYPRFPGDAIATFMEPIAKGVAARGREVHVVAPWNPAWRRAPVEDHVRFHLYRYAPAPGLNLFGYAAALRADVRLRASAVAVTPLALAAGIRCARRTVRQTGAAIVHAHWVVPSGAMSLFAAGRRPLVVSLHGSDVYVAERHPLVGRVVRETFRRAAWVTACSEDLRARAVALGARPDRISVVPYGVDSDRFRPDAELAAAGRARLGISANIPLVFAFGRLVGKKGFEYLIDAVPSLLREFPALRVVIAGQGDLAGALRDRAAVLGVGDAVVFPGVIAQNDIPSLLAAADVAVVPSVHDDAGNVDGLPNTVLEILASGTPLVATTVGGIGAVAVDGQSARLVPERDPDALTDAIAALLKQPALGADLGRRARDTVCRAYGWAQTAQMFDDIYARVSV